jgi:hypothetical protein
VGGYLAHRQILHLNPIPHSIFSLAIMTDAFHMLSDLSSFLISIMAIQLSRRSSTTRHSFGFQRAEVLGALSRQSPHKMPNIPKLFIAFWSFGF